MKVKPKIDNTELLREIKMKSKITAKDKMIEDMKLGF